MKKSVEKLFKIVFIIIVITAMAAPKMVFAQDAVPTDPPAEEEVTEAQVVEEAAAPTEAPVVEETAAPTEVLVVEETVVPTEAPVVEETDVQTEAVNDGAVETAAPTEAPVVDENLAEVVELLDTAEITIVDENGDALPMASQEAADVISNSDPFYWDATTLQWVGYTETTCPSFVTDCHVVAADTAFAAALAAVPADSTLYVASGYYDEEVTLSMAGLSFTAFNTISGIAGDPTAPSYTQGFASIRALILDAAFNATLGVYADQITVTENGYLSDALNLANPANLEATITADVKLLDSGNSVRDAYHSDDTKFELECGEPHEPIETGKIYRMVLKNPKSLDVLGYYGTNANDETSDLIIGASMSEQTTLSFMDPDLTCPSGFSEVGGVCTKNPSCGDWYSYNSGDNLCHYLPNWWSTKSPNCLSGATLNPVTDKCEKAPDPVCPTGTVYNSGSGMCDLPAWSNLNEKYEFWKLLNKYNGHTNLTTPIFNYIQDYGSSVPITQKLWFLWPTGEIVPAYCMEYGHNNGESQSQCDDWGETWVPAAYNVTVPAHCEKHGEPVGDSQRHCNDWGEEWVPAAPISPSNTQLTFLKLPIPQTGCTDPALCPKPPCQFNPEIPFDDPECPAPCQFNSEIPFDDPECPAPCQFNQEIASTDPECPAPCVFNPQIASTDPACPAPCVYNPLIASTDPACVPPPPPPPPTIPVTGATPALAIPVTGGALIPVTGGTLIVSGLGHSCMTYNNGQVICWGLNASGQLGDGTQVDKKEAVYVKDLTGVMNLTAGGKHTCALTASGDIWCWGENSSGQLGNGSTTNSNVPVQVTGLPDKVLSITAGEEFTCVQLMNQEVWCWGKNNLGQLNDGTTDTQTSPVKSKLSNMMAQISGGQGLLLGSDVLGSVNEWVKAQAAAVKELENTLSISANRWGETGCAVSADGSVKCWGSDLLSIPVTGALSAMEVGTGLDHNCTINNDQSVSCWGSNGSGQLGDGTNKDSDSATMVKNLSLAKSLAVGAHHTCVLSGIGNTAMCWGENTFGQLGNGSATNSNVPVLVVLPK